MKDLRTLGWVCTLALACGSPEPRETSASDSIPGAPAPGADSRRSGVSGPTLIAFYPSAPESESGAEPSEDLSAALDDFSQHLSAARDGLAAMGFRVETQPVDSVRMVQDTLGVAFQIPPDSADIGYYFAAPGGPPMIIYGVRTNTEILATARSFLSRTR